MKSILCYVFGHRMRIYRHRDGGIDPNTVKVFGYCCSRCGHMRVRFKFSGISDEEHLRLVAAFDQFDAKHPGSLTPLRVEYREDS